MLEDPGLGKLTELLKQGDRAAFNKLYAMHWKKLFSIAYQALGSADDAKDIVQDTFVKVWDKREQLDTSCQVSGFLFTILKNNIINYLKKELSRKKRLQNAFGNREEKDHSPEDHYEASQLSVLLEREINQLPPKMRHILVLSRNKNMAIKEIATALNIAPQTVKNQLSNALRILRSKI